MRPLIAPASSHPCRRPRPAVATTSLLVAILATTFLAVPIPARAATPQVLLDRPKVGEYQPIRGSGWLAWQQNTSRRPRHYDVFARPNEGGRRVKVNEAGTNGANGDIEEGVLVYQQFQRDRSGLRLFDLETGERTVPPPGVNTRSWEYWPSLSEGHLLFGRHLQNGTRTIILFDLSSGTGRRLARIRGANAFLAPGQVHGDWAVWHRCPSRSECNVIRYRISTGEVELLDNPGGRQYAPSVADDGTVYFARGRGSCGNRVRLMKQPLEGDAEELWRLPNGDDVGRTHAQTRRMGTTILYDHFSCGRATGSDAWELLE